jgi:hypothetical protein
VKPVLTCISTGWLLAAEAAGQRPRGLTTLFALPGALALVDPRLATPPGIESIPALAARWKVHRAQTSELLSDLVIDALAQRLRRHLRREARDPSEVIALKMPTPESGKPAIPT